MNEVGHVISTQGFRRAWLEKKFFQEARDMEIVIRERPSSLLSVLAGKDVLLLFWKRSIRTSNIFKLASKMLGANTELKEGEQKGEKWQIPYSSETGNGSLEDMIRTFAEQGHDCLIMKHPKEGLVERAAAIVDKFGYKTKIINAGDGPGQHPIQALIDLYSIKKDFGKIDGLTGVIMGDLLHSPAVHSLVDVLGKFNTKIICMSPSELKMPEKIIQYLDRCGVQHKEISPLEVSDIKKSFDFLYVVTVPETMESAEEEMPIINRSFANEFLKTGSKVYHPFPRGKEITPWLYEDKKSQRETIDETKHAGYFGQIKNSKAVISAILKMAINPSADIRKLEDNWELFTKK